MTNDWPCMQWTIDSLITKVGDNEVMIRGKTNKEGQAHDMFSRILGDEFSNLFDQMMCNICFDFLKLLKTENNLRKVVIEGMACQLPSR